MYPIVEATTALAFIGGYLLYGLTLLGARARAVRVR